MEIMIHLKVNLELRKWYNLSRNSQRLAFQIPGFIYKDKRKAPNSQEYSAKKTSNLVIKKENLIIILS